MSHTNKEFYGYNNLGKIIDLEIHLGGEVKVIQIDGTFSLKGENMFKKKLKVYYSNGRSYTATRVGNINLYDDTLDYSQKKIRGGVTICSEVEVSLKDVIAYEVWDGNKREVIRVKPSAKINIEVGQRG